MSATKVVNMAKSLLGIKYTWGGSSPAYGFDSTGLVIYCYKHAVGIDFSRSANTLIQKGKAVKQADLKPADLIFTNAHHVGIYIGNGEFIHAPKTGEVVKISKVTEFYAGRRIL